jgi:hypothetical protein
MLALLATVAATAASAHAPAVGPVRVCSALGYDTSAAVCRTATTRPLSGRLAACSVAGSRQTLAGVKARMTFRGLAVADGTTAVVERGTKGMSVRVALGLPLPAGAWVCRFDGPRLHLRKTFRTKGSTSAILYAGVCDDKNALAYTEDDPILCAAGAARPVTTKFWLATALVPVAKGHTLSVHLLQNDADVVPAVDVVGRGALEVLSLSDDGSTELEPGSYVCRFVLDGQTVAELPFTAGASSTG